MLCAVFRHPGVPGPRQHTARGGSLHRVPPAATVRSVWAQGPAPPCLPLQTLTPRQRQGQGERQREREGEREGERERRQR